MSADLFDLLEARHSVRAFLPDAVPRADLERILSAARRAPSGANLQPGSFHALTGGPLADLKAALAREIDAATPPQCDYSYFPEPMPAALKSRQRAAGYALYAALGIARRDVAGRRAQFRRNYRFFDAPVGIVVTIDRRMGAGCFMDLGMAMMSLMLAAQAMGYGSTGIGALANYGGAVRESMGLSGEEIVVCGIALGRPDPTAPVNQFRTERAALADFTSFRGFD